MRCDPGKNPIFREKSGFSMVPENRRFSYGLHVSGNTPQKSSKNRKKWVFPAPRTPKIPPKTLRKTRFSKSGKKGGFFGFFKNWKKRRFLASDVRLRVPIFGGGAKILSL
jgi:hypothetical protein